MGGGKKKALEEAPAPASTPTPGSTTDIPAFDSPEFVEFVASGALLDILADEEKLNALLSDSK